MSMENRRWQRIDPIDPTPQTEPITQAGRDWYENERIHNVAQRTRADDRHDERLLARIRKIEDEAFTDGATDYALKVQPAIEAAAAARAEAEKAYEQAVLQGEVNVVICAERDAAWAERDAATAQLAALAEAVKDTILFLAQEGHPALACDRLEAALANLPAAAQEWEEKWRAETLRQVADARDEGYQAGYDAAYIEPALYLDLRSPDAERRLAEFQHQSFQQWAGHCGNQTESYDDHMAAHEANVTANLAALRSQAASQPAEPVE